MRPRRSASARQLLAFWPVFCFVTMNFVRYKNRVGHSPYVRTYVRTAVRQPAPAMLRPASRSPGPARCHQSELGHPPGAGATGVVRRWLLPCCCWVTACHRCGCLGGCLTQRCGHRRGISPGSRRHILRRRRRRRRWRRWWRWRRRRRRCAHHWCASAVGLDGVPAGVQHAHRGDGVRGPLGLGRPTARDDRREPPHHRHCRDRHAS
jgi:hypothetical protein